MKNTPALLLACGVLLFASCTSSKIAEEKPRNAQDIRANSMGYGTKADEIQPSAKYESLSEKNLSEYDGNISAELLKDYLTEANKKKN